MLSFYEEHSNPMVFLKHQMKQSSTSLELKAATLLPKKQHKNFKKFQTIFCLIYHTFMSFVAFRPSPSSPKSAISTLEQSTPLLLSHCKNSFKCSFLFSRFKTKGCCFFCSLSNNWYNSTNSSHSFLKGILHSSKKL